MIIETSTQMLQPRRLATGGTSLQVEPISTEFLGPTATFLSQHMNERISATKWRALLEQPWMPDRPNSGFMLLDDGAIVGVLCAIYSIQLIDDRPQAICNLTSWCVLPRYRSHSVRLLLACITQAGFAYTNFTPAPVVGKVCEFFKFSDLCSDDVLVLNLPTTITGLAGVRVLSDPVGIEQVLSGWAKDVARDHVQLPWLRHAAMAGPEGCCYVVYKRALLRGILPVARIRAVSDRKLFRRYLPALQLHLLRRGLPATFAEVWVVGKAPALAIRRKGSQRRMYLGPGLKPEKAPAFYSELLFLDI